MAGLEAITHSAITWDADQDGGIVRWRRALDDAKGGLANVALWGTLGWQDIRQRYRRSVLGPFWLTISTAVMVGALGYLYAALFRQPLDRFLPFVAVGMIVWALISSLLNEACRVFIAAEGMIKQVPLPLTTHVCRTVWRNLIIFGHNAVILVVVYLVWGTGWHADLLTLLPALALVAINGWWMGCVLGLFCTRFRDIEPIIANVVQLAFFVTPIMWMPEILADRAWIAAWNPAYHFIELVRSPILGQGVPWRSWAVAVPITGLGVLAALFTLARYRHRIAYWL